MKKLSSCRRYEKPWCSCDVTEELNYIRHPQTQVTTAIKTEDKGCVIFYLRVINRRWWPGILFVLHKLNRTMLCLNVCFNIYNPVTWILTWTFLSVTDTMHAWVHHTCLQGTFMPHNSLMYDDYWPDQPHSIDRCQRPWFKDPNPPVTWRRGDMSALSALLAICGVIHRWPMDSPHKGSIIYILRWLYCCPKQVIANSRIGCRLRRHGAHVTTMNVMLSGLILGLRPANKRRRYIATTSLIGWAQA